jgi:signal transduction histidine kinase
VRAAAEAAAEAAEAAAEARERRLAETGHDFRTPLHAIAGYVDLLLDRTVGPLQDDQRRYVESIRRGQEHLLVLVNGLLDEFRLAHAPAPLTVTDVPVHEALAQIHILAEPQLHAKGHRYEYGGGEPAVTVRADRTRFEQVMLNLLTNAVKYTPPGGRIRVDWERVGRHVQIRVEDTGCGIPAGEQQRVFEAFVRGNGAVTGRDGDEGAGLGLGLAISRRFARAMGGDLTVRSAAGAGSVFTLTLPVGTQRAAPTQAAGD